MGRRVRVRVRGRATNRGGKRRWFGPWSGEERGSGALGRHLLALLHELPLLVSQVIASEHGGRPLLDLLHLSAGRVRVLVQVNAGLHPSPLPHGAAHHCGRRRKRAGRRHVKVAGAKRQREGGRRRATRHRSARARHAHDRRICERCHTRCTWEKSEEDAVCTKLRSGVLVGLFPGHRRQAVKCPRAPFSWKPSAESEKKSAMVRRSSSIARNYRKTSVVGALSPVA